MSESNNDMKIAVEAAIDALDWDKLDQRRDELYASGQMWAATKDPPIPSCDACGKEWSGNLKCSVCDSVFYCSKDCQRIAWKEGGHKKACKTMKSECERMGKEVVDCMMNGTGRARTHPDDLLQQIDTVGSYQAAVSAGLEKAILQLFKEETNEEALVQRWRSTNGPDGYSMTQEIMCSIFRGQRVEGRGTKCRGFSAVDAQRIKEYIHSDPTALDVWFDASMSNVKVPFDAAVHQSIHQPVALRSARDVLAAWCLIFTNARASRYVLFNGNRESDESTMPRAKSIAKRIAKTLAKRWSVSNERDPGGTLEGMMMQIAAMIHYRLKEYKVEIDFEKLLKLKGICAQTYKSMAVPLAEATIKKGATLTNDEARGAMASHGRGSRR
jgi:hypothetical protein